MPYYLYILKCADGSYYTGSSRNPDEREKHHNEGRGAKYTFKRRPVKLVYTEEFANHLDAYRRELQISKWSRAKKSALIQVDIQALKKLRKRRVNKSF